MYGIVRFASRGRKYGLDAMRVALLLVCVVEFVAHDKALYVAALFHAMPAVVQVSRLLERVAILDAAPEVDRLPAGIHFGRCFRRQVLLSYGNPGISARSYDAMPL